ncbi:iron-containing alcohol dehydrogenase [Ferrimonas sp. SCSIO 43195]|uniref:iron-containing alcohol dehydrogenase n=1 Tax=Ferrimonas sp. SCSIO 43195 TaxID=2822844 RepID=UPI0020758605|nr:iron-containing alcohol dehydrogenase [Ferrimonas sp. SCSIO 43195]USD36042.1 iron-containing alcohol dehydrogenase [Ferrimonas sp. SCSIO 43195]
MNNFDYHNPTRILFGEGEIANIGNYIPAGSKVMVLYGGGSIKANGVYQQVSDALAEFDWVEHGGISPNPKYDELMAAVKVVKAQQVDFLLAVGGGSVADGTKFVAAAAKYQGQDPWDILAKQVPVTEALPLATILTLPATGSEANGNSVVTRGEDKLAFNSPLVFPQFSVLDPTTTYTLPARQVANGVVDAFVHTIEQYLTYPVNSPIQDRFAESLLLTLIEEGPKAMADVGKPAEQQDYDVRANIMWAATLALNTLIGKGVPQDWATHMIGHELTAVLGLDHAQTLAVVLPSLMQAQRQPKREKLLQYAERIWGLSDGDEETRIDAAIANTRAFFETMQVKTRISEYGHGAEVVDTLMAQLERHGMVKLGERGDIDLAKSRAILDAAV